MNTKLRILMAMCLVLFVAASFVATAVDAHNGRVVKLTVGTFTVNDDSSNSQYFELRKAGDVGADKDTSDIYDCVNIDHIVIQVKGTPKLDELTVRAAATALDSGASIVYTQGSNDKVYWKDIDTTTAADSLAVSEEIWFKERTYRFLRWRVDTTTKSDDSGVAVQIKINAVNR